MFIAPETILLGNKQAPIIRSTVESVDLHHEGVCFDLHLSEVYEVLQTSGIITTTHRRTSSTTLISRESDTYKLHNKMYLAQTVENVELPDGYTALVYPRSTLFRSGIIFQSAPVSAGYAGKLTFGIYNTNTAPFEIDHLSRFAQIAFADVRGNQSKYKGQWSGGRVSQHEMEKQV